MQLPQRSIEAYVPIVGAEAVGDIRRLASYLKGARVQHINSTAQGGGVAELLGFLVPLMRDVGLDAHWDVLAGNPAFFEVTKALHNSLHGERQLNVDETGVELVIETRGPGHRLELLERVREAGYALTEMT